MESSNKSQLPTGECSAQSTAAPESTTSAFSCKLLLLKLMKHLQIVLILAEFALTIMFIRHDATSSDKCMDGESKTKIVIILCILQLIFGIVMILNNFHRFYQRLLLPSACSLIIYLNARYAYLYILFINIYYYREKQNKQNGTTTSAISSDCYLPVWFDLLTLVIFHIFLFQLYLHMKSLRAQSQSSASSSTDKAPKLALPTYSQVQSNPTKYPVFVTEAPAPSYNECMNSTQVKNPIESV